MKVREPAAGPIFAADGPVAPRMFRRVRGIVLETLAFILVTVLLIPMLLIAALVDLVLWLGRRKPWVAVRLVAFLWWFLFGEMRALVTILGISIFTGGPIGGDSMRRRRWLYGLRISWGRSHLGGIRVLFGLKFEIEGMELAGPGPLIVMMRHASIIDNMLPDSTVGKNQGLGLRFVIKRELEVLPTIDIGGRWVPTIFVKRASKNPEAEMALVRQLTHNLGEGEAILIYPEGTRWTEKKMARAKEIIAERQPEISPMANRLNNLLPPRLGGPLALIDEAPDVDVVVCGHVGFAGFQYISDIWAGGLVGSTIRVKFWRYAAAEIPTDEQGRIEWLYEIWQRLDDWAGEHRVERTHREPDGAELPD